MESIAARRSQGAGGSDDRMLSTLLVQLDGMLSAQAGPRLFVIAATQRVGKLDDAVVRPGGVLRGMLGLCCTAG